MHILTEPLGSTSPLVSARPWKALYLAPVISVARFHHPHTRSASFLSVCLFHLVFLAASHILRRHHRSHRIHFFLRLLFLAFRSRLLPRFLTPERRRSSQSRVPWHTSSQRAPQSIFVGIAPDRIATQQLHNKPLLVAPSSFVTHASYARFAMTR